MNQSVIKALKLLDLFTENTKELTLKEIARKADLPKPTAYRLLSSLESMNFLYKIKESEHDSRYRLGIKLLELGQLVRDQLELRKIALPYMESLANEIQEAVHLVIPHQQMAVYIEKVDSKKAIRLDTRIGKSSSLLIGSGPKLLLAHLPEEEQAQVIGEGVDYLKLYDELCTIREQGYAYSIGEQDPDTTGISYPIFDFHQHVVGALTVSGLSHYFTGNNLQKIKKETLNTAFEISSKLGFKEIHDSYSKPNL
ncbi:IclR family transcriptional regulator [Ornithinibacillus halophilus]|uniref:Glycerol operon regulatory protein n=1 Tax=Ornithinibacillus halophilus TaxID=930117 RepID=A0A1M5EWV4_9BACI|nr:IclR family transcriptional regulator [Ornithinibacillus halophilus]SHF83733.1 transcriptional regulator, IclR family [Ornithinibacillus halophilus]